GRAVGRFHAVRHGLTAKDPIAATGRQEEFLGILHELESDLSPADASESAIVHVMAVALWRQHHAWRLEAQFVETPGALRTNIRTFERISRFAASAQRAIYRALHALQRLRQERPLAVAQPAAVSITSPASAARLCTTGAHKKEKLQIEPN